MKARVPTPERSRPSAAPPAAARALAPTTATARPSCACGGRCPRCADAREADADRLAQATLMRPGAEAMGRVRGGTLSGVQRAFFEPVVGVPLAGVRLHDGPAAEVATRREGARAYAIGDDVVLGRRDGAADAAGVLAHELAHVAQQRRGAPRVLQRLGDWAPEYKRRDGSVKTYTELGYEQYMKLLGPLPAASKGNPRAHRFPLGEEITEAEFLDLFPQIRADLDAAVVSHDVVELNRHGLNTAFRVLRIDTVEAQSAYIANATHESAQLRSMTETAGPKLGNRPYETNPAKARLDTDWLERAAAESEARKRGKPPPPDQALNVHGYEHGGTILPRGDDWHRSFIGRGPVQVTHRHGYVQALAVLERRLQELEADGSDEAGAQALRDAIVAIKADPEQAANPAHAYLLSAAMMKTPDEKGTRGDQKASRGQVTSWMGQQPEDVAKLKQEHYVHAMSVLMPKYDDEVRRAAGSGP